MVRLTERRFYRSVNRVSLSVGLKDFMLGKIIASGVSAVLVVALLLALVTIGGCSSESESVEITPGEPVTRRISPTQYRNIISDIFGSDIRLGGRFEPELRVEGLLAAGSSEVSVSPAGMEQYDGMARNIAQQVLSEQNRALFIPCTPQSVARPDDACAAEFLSGVGRLLFRRPLNESELDLYVLAAHKATETVGDFYDGMALGLAAMLTSPQFLFWTETLEEDPERQGQYRLDGYSKASRLSFFLWNSAPDELLLRAAESGELDTERGLKFQAQRMLSSPRLEEGVRAFFSDMLHLNDMENVAKDSELYPKWSPRVAADAKEQTLRTIVHLLLEEQADYRELFTTKKTFLTPLLASIYRVPLASDVPNGAPMRWQLYEFPEDDPRGGLMMHTSFLTLHSHAGRGSPTLRGAATREILMCQKVPAPPADVDFAIVQDTTNTVHKTARERLAVHNEDPSCAGCHKVMDPIGIALENFDGAGEWRTHENGVLIDTSGELDGVPFENVVDLVHVTAENPAVASCVTDRLFAYARGRMPTRGEIPWVRNLRDEFAESGYVLPLLMERMVTDESFYLAMPSEQTSDSAQLASNNR